MHFVETPSENVFGKDMGVEQIAVHIRRDSTLLHLAIARQLVTRQRHLRFAHPAKCDAVHDPNRSTAMRTYGTLRFLTLHQEVQVLPPANHSLQSSKKSRSEHSTKNPSHNKPRNQSETDWNQGLSSEGYSLRSLEESSSTPAQTIPDFAAECQQFAVGYARFVHAACYYDQAL